MNQKKFLALTATTVVVLAAGVWISTHRSSEQSDLGGATVFADLKPALNHLENVVAVLNKNEDNLDNSLRLMKPFYRVFASTLGNGPWFDTYIQNLPPVPQVGG